MLQIQKISTYGTSTPAMAHTDFQSSELLKFIDVPEERKKGYEEGLFELMRHILRCGKIIDRISTELAEGK
jgi:hypothetical protein